MIRGFFLSTALHGAVLSLFLFAPRPAAFEWDRSDVIAVELLQAPVPEEVPARETPEPTPPEPEPEPAPTETPAEPPAEKPVETVEPPEPAPVTAAKPKPVRPPRTYKPIAPRREDEGPSLAERLRERMTTPEEATEPAATEPPPHPTTPRSSAEVEASDFPYAWYLNLLRTKITDSWDPPGGRLVEGHANRVVVRLRIHRDGRVTDVAVQDGSDTPGLDASARRAVERAQPFPPLPEAYEGDHLDVGVRFTVAEGGP